MEPTLDEAVQTVFGAQQPQNPAQASLRLQPELGDAQKDMQQGNWGNFGKAMDALERSLAGPPQ